MSTIRATPSRALFSGQRTAYLAKVITNSFINSPPSCTAGLRSSYHLIHTNTSALGKRGFSSTTNRQLEVFPPPRDAPSIRVTPAAWQHPVYSEDAMEQIAIARRDVKTWSDWTAFNLVRFLRWSTDLATGYRHQQEIKKLKNDPLAKRFIMTERKWLTRFIFLESIAGVPGIVGGMLRHLRSLRRMQRDNGWIESLLEEAYNERMHLLTFLKMAEPGRFMKFMVLGAQGVFSNAFFLAYLVSPRTCHRFVGYLEEEAVMTYTHCIRDIEAGRLPSWDTLDAPEIAVRYWNMPEGHRKMRDLLLYVRADEAKHREVNHTLGNLDWHKDPNPYVSEYKDETKAHPQKGIELRKPVGWERQEVI